MSTVVASPNFYPNFNAPYLTDPWRCYGTYFFGLPCNMMSMFHGPPRLRKRESFVKKQESILVWWNPPEPGWIKLNFDGAVSKGLAGCGHVLRDDSGMILVAGCRNTRKLDVIDAELRGLWEGLKTAVEISEPGQKIWIEGDSLVIVEALKRRFGAFLRGHPVAKDILRLLDHFSECVVSHIYREGNQTGDWLAGKGKFSQELLLWTSNFPLKLVMRARRDLQGCFQRIIK